MTANNTALALDLSNEELTEKFISAQKILREALVEKIGGRKIGSANKTKG